MKSLVYICSLSCPLEGKLCESRDLVVSSKYLLGGLMSEWYHFHLSLYTQQAFGAFAQWRVLESRL